MERLTAAAKLMTALETAKLEAKAGEHRDITLLIGDDVFRADLDADIHQYTTDFLLHVIEQESAGWMEDELPRLEWFAEYLQACQTLGEDPFPEFYIDFHDIGVVNPFTSECGRFDVNPFEYYGRLFVESPWYSKAKVDAVLEPIRVAVTVFLHRTDPSGGYLDDDEKMSFDEAMKYFFWYANVPLLDNRSNFTLGTQDADTAFKRVCSAGLFYETMRVMFDITNRDRKWTFKDLRMYGAHWVLENKM